MLAVEWRRRLWLSVLAGIGSVAGCSEEGPTGDPTIHCQTVITSQFSSPAPGALTLHGQFYANETVIVEYQSGAQTVSVHGTPPTDRTSLTLTGLPSGSRSFDLFASCLAGQDSHDSAVIDIL